MQKLKVLRKKNNYTAAQMAASLGLSLRAYESYEQGKREPKIKTLIQIKNILKCSFEDLI